MQNNDHLRDANSSNNIEMYTAHLTILWSQARNLLDPSLVTAGSSRTVTDSSVGGRRV